ncbi:MAG TPA: efflux RND transporter periplasmic adaptor subunit [Longimicrobiales bacterium]
MSTRPQWLVSAAVLGGAVAVVAVYFAAIRPRAERGTTETHVHGAAAVGGDGPRAVRLSEDAARRIGITYAAAAYGPLERTVRVVGTISHDETRLVKVSPKFEGWVERLYVDFTGAPVREGEPLLAVYSPMLVATQEELILARKLAEQTVAGARAAENARALVAAARRRLRYWDIPEDEIEQIERGDTARRTLVLRAPASGLVLEKNVVEGMRIVPGMDLYTIADLSQVWVEGEVFEKDLALVRLGQHARVSFDAYPGTTVDAVVTYIHPTLSTETRTGRIRLELANPDLRFKPGMYATVEFEVPVHRAGVHVPRTAVLTTGERSIVFVRSADGKLQPRAITPGLAAGEHIEIVAGLEAGEVVVASASFLVDAEANLRAALEAMGSTHTSVPAGPGAAGHAGH